MATAALGMDDRSVSIGRIFSRAFGTLGGNPVATFGIALLFGALPWILIIYGVASVGVEGFAALGTTATIAAALFSVGLFVLLSMITQGALVRATVAHSEGRKASLAESAMAGLAVVIPLFLLGLLSALGLLLGLLLLVVPGIILYVIWSVAAPALVEERLGPIQALRRSHYLTRGSRWKIFALMVILLVIYWVYSTVVQMLSMMWLGTEANMAVAGGDMGGMSYFWAGFLAVNILAGTVTSAVWGVMLSSLYVELRDWKEGPRTEALADIFG